MERSGLLSGERIAESCARLKVNACTVLVASETTQQRALRVRLRSDASMALAARHELECTFDVAQRVVASVQQQPHLRAVVVERRKAWRAQQRTVEHEQRLVEPTGVGQRHGVRFVAPQGLQFVVRELAIAVVVVVVACDDLTRIVDNSVTQH